MTSTKNIDYLLQKAISFSKIAQTITGNQQVDSFFEKAWDNPLPGEFYSFRYLGQTAIDLLAAKHKGATDYDQKQGVIYQFMDLLNTNQIPNAQRLWSLVSSIENALKTDYPPSAGNDAGTHNAGVVAQLLPKVAARIVNEFLQPPTNSNENIPANTISQSPAALAPAPKAKPAENLPQFLSRVYRQLKQNASLDSTDQEKLQTAKPVLQRRLNGLNGLATRTTNQEQERNVLQMILTKV